MAVTKLNPLYFVPLRNQNQLPTQIPQPANLHLLPFKEPSALSLKTQPNLHNLLPINAHSFSVAFPSLAFSNTLLFASNVQLIVGEDEPEEKLISRFRREVMKAGVIRECRRRRFFECNQEKRKRKSREAARRNRKRRPQAKVLKTDVKAETSKKKKRADSDEDNWEFLDIDIPYC